MADKKKSGYVPRTAPENLPRMVAEGLLNTGSYVQDEQGQLYHIVGMSEIQNPDLQPKPINKAVDIRNKYIEALAAGEDAYATPPEKETFAQKAARLGINLQQYRR